MPNSAIRTCSKFERSIKEGLTFAVNGGADTVNVDKGVVFLHESNTYKDCAGNAALALSAPGSSGNVKRNYIRINCTASVLSLSVYATAEGVTPTALVVSDLNADAAHSSDGQDHYKYEYIGYVDVDGTPGSVDADAYDIRKIASDI